MYGQIQASPPAPIVEVDPLDHPQSTLTQFSEGDAPWQSLPRWAAFLIKFGFICGAVAPRVRRIVIVSMPCDSAGAGLVALGAMRYRLSLEAADDCSSHFQRLERLAIQGTPTTYLRNDAHKGTFLIEHRAGCLWARRGKSAIAIFPWNALAWRVEGEARVQARQGTTLPYGPLYEALGDGLGTIAASNLSRSDSAICLAGRVMGQAASAMMLATIRFRTADQVVDLSGLLTVNGSSNNIVSRVTFFNTRTGQFDRGSGLPSLVVSDGLPSFLKVINANEFQNSDVVGVVHRDVERERLEVLGNKVADLAQWYIADRERIEEIPAAPPGISVSMLRRRQT